MTGRRHNSRGFALLIVLWALVPLTLMVLILAKAAQSDTRAAADLRSAASLEAEADGAIYTAVFGLLAGTVGVATGPRPIAPDVAVEVVGLSGLVNPNTAAAPLLGALLVRVGAPDATARLIARAMEEWRTPGQRAGPRGTKANDYRAAGLDYGPPGAPFESLDEIGLVLGMSPPLLRALKLHLSLYAEGDPDPLAASPVVRQALRDIGVVRGTGPSATEVMQITATATGPGDTQATRRAVIRFGPSANGRTWRVLSWNPVFRD